MTKVSKTGYRKNSKDKNEPYLVVPSGNISMEETNGSPLEMGSILGIDNLGNMQEMLPGANYQFPGNSVLEIPMNKKTRKVKIGKIKKYQGDDGPSTVNSNFYYQPNRTKQQGEWYYAPYDINNPNLRIGTLEGNIPSQYRGSDYSAGSYTYASPGGIDLTGLDPNNFKFKQRWYDETRGNEDLYSQDFYVKDGNLYSKQPFAIGDQSVEPKPILISPQGEPVDIDWFIKHYPFAFGSSDLQNYLQSGVGSTVLKTLSSIPNSPILPNADGTFTLVASPNKTDIVTFLQDMISKNPSMLQLGTEPFPGSTTYDDLVRDEASRYFLHPELYTGKPADAVNVTYGSTPEEQYDLALSRQAYKGALQDMQTPLAKGLGSTGEPPKSVMDRNKRIAADEIAAEKIVNAADKIGIGSIMGALNQDGSVNTRDPRFQSAVNTEQFRSLMDMDPKIFRDIINSPFGYGVIKLKNNKGNWTDDLTITASEAEQILSARIAIENSGKFNFLTEASPVDKAIQGVGNTLSWLGGNWDNAEGEGTIGNIFNNFVGYNARNKGYDLLDAAYAPVEAVKNTVLSMTVNDPSQTPSMSQTNLTWNPNWSPLENQIAKFTYDLATDPIGLGGLKAVNKAGKVGKGVIGAFRNAVKNENRILNPNLITELQYASEPGSTMYNTEKSIADYLEDVRKFKADAVSPFDLNKYNYAPGTSSGKFGSPLFISGYGKGDTALTIDGARYFNELSGTKKYREYSTVDVNDLKLHFDNVFNKYAPRPSRSSGTFKDRGIPFGDPTTDFAIGTKFPNKWTKSELAASKDIHFNKAYDILGNASKWKDSAKEFMGKGLLKPTLGAAFLGAAELLGRDYYQPLFNQAVPYINAAGRKLGAQSDIVTPFSRSGNSGEEGSKAQTMISLNDEGNTVSSARVNEKAEGDVIIGGEFIENANNTVNKADWFKNNQDALIGDKQFTVSSVPAYYGVEDGKFKAGSIDEFKPETVVVPIRNFQNAYTPIKEVGVTGEGTLRFTTDPANVSKTDYLDRIAGVEDTYIYNNAPMGGKLIMYSPKDKQAWFIYNSNPNATANSINQLIKEHGDIRYIPIDNGRYEHYVDKKDGLLTQEDFDAYYKADIERAGNPGYNLVLKRKGKMYGGPVYRDGGQLPKAQFGDRGIQKSWNTYRGEPTYADSAELSKYADKYENYLRNSGYIKTDEKKADKSAISDIGNAISRFSEKSQILGTRGAHHVFPHERNESYVRKKDNIYSVGDLSPAVYNFEAPLQKYHPGIIPNSFKTYGKYLPFGSDGVGFYDYDKLAITPWSDLSEKQKLTRIKRYGTTGTPFKSRKDAISFLTQKLNEPVITPITVEQQVTNTPTTLQKQDLGDPEFMYRILPTYGQQLNLITNPEVYSGGYSGDFAFGDREGGDLMYTEPYQERGFYKDMEYPDYDNPHLTTRAKGNYANSVVIDGQQYNVQHPTEGPHRGYGLVEIPNRGLFRIDYRSGKPELRRAPAAFRDGGTAINDDEMQAYMESYIREKENNKKQKPVNVVKKGGETKDYFAGYLPMYYFL